MPVLPAVNKGTSIVLHLHLKSWLGLFWQHGRSGQRTSIADEAIQPDALCL